MNLPSDVTAIRVSTAISRYIKDLDVNSHGVMMDTAFPFPLFLYLQLSFSSVTSNARAQDLDPVHLFYSFSPFFFSRTYVRS
jgi:hypothetical protein